MKQHDENTLTGKGGLWLVLLLGELAVLAFLAGITVYSSDDYWYSTFLRDGLGEFWRLVKFHYQVFNGRVVVHLLAWVVLHVGNGLFAVVCVGFFLLLPWMGGRINYLPREQVPAALLLFLSGILLMPTAMMKEGVLWISAFCNYVFPSLLLTGYVLLMETYLRRERGQKGNGPLLLAVCLVQFLCGATTEQSGLAAVGVALCYTLFCLLFQRGKCLPCLLISLWGGAGLLTIFLSPATQTRMQEEVMAEEGPAMDLVAALHKQAETLCEGLLFPILLGLLFAGTYLLFFREKKGVVPKAALALSELGVVLLYLTQGAGKSYLYGFVLLCLALCALALLAVGRRGSCALLAAGLASNVLMLVTDSIGFRNILPCYLYLLVVVAVMGAELAAGLSLPVRRGGAILLALLSLVTIGLDVPHYWENYQVDQRNKAHEEEAKTTGVLRYCMDYDMEYTWIKPYYDGYFYGTYWEALPKELQTADIYFYGTDYAPVYAGGVLCKAPATRNEGEETWLLPVADILRQLGGEVVWSEDFTTIRFRGTDYLCTVNGDQETISWEKDGAAQSVNVQRALTYYKLCFPAQVYEELFGLTVSSAQGETTPTFSVEGPGPV